MGVATGKYPNAGYTLVLMGPSLMVLAKAGAWVQDF